MTYLAVVGAQWGDEGKGKVVDYISEKMDVVVRSQGGNNAGHTIVVGNEQTILHVVPSGILHKDKICIIGNGVVVDPAVLFKEIQQLRKKGINVTEKNLAISDRAHVIMPYHIALDKAKDSKKGIGTTLRGIGPAYSDKYSRTGIRMHEFVNTDLFRKKLKEALEEKNFILENYYKIEPLSFEKIFSEYSELGNNLRPFVKDTSVLLNKLIKDKKNILFEGAQGTMLDIDHGTYPYVTSSNSSVGGVCTGLGISPLILNKIIAIFKAYTTRVGSGPFVTELKDSTGEEIRKKGNEFGATTGRARRCGWFDAVMGKYSARINGFTSIVITKLDVLSGLEKIKICIAYEYNNKKITDFPADLNFLESCKPVYEELDGWKEDISSARKFDELPENARKYLKRVEALLKTKISMVSIGPKREQTIILKEF